MRTYGRVTDRTGARFWVEVDPDANGNPDQSYLTALVQTLKLNLGESPFFYDRAIPAHQRVVTQSFPYHYLVLTQQRYAPYFMSLAVAKQPLPTPTYDVSVQFKTGARISVSVIPAPALDQY